MNTPRMRSALARTLAIVAICACVASDAAEGTASPTNGSSPVSNSFRQVHPADANALWSAQEYYFTHLTTAEGLSDSKINAVVQDRRGFMWFGTGLGGLNRYDGYEFKFYQHDPKAPRSLSQNIVTALFLDHLGILWVGTESGGLDRYDADTDDFTHFRPIPGNDESLPSGLVRAISEDASDALWVGTEKGGLSRLDRATGTFRTYRHHSNDPYSLSSETVDSVFCDPDTDEVWAGTREAGVCRLVKGATHFTVFQTDPNAPGSIQGSRGLAFCKDRSGTLWIGTDQGLNRFVPETETFVHYRNDPANTNSVSGDWVWKLHEDRRGRFWVCTPRGVNLMDRATGTFTHVPFFGPDDSQHLIGRAIQCVCEDNTGAIWFGHVELGVSRLHSEPRRFTTFRKGNPGETDGLAHDTVMSVYTDRKNCVWIGTAKGLDFMENGRPPIRHIQFPNLASLTVHHVTEDGEGGYWIAAFPQGLFHLRGDEVTKLPANPDDPTRPVTDEIWAVAPDPRHGVWVVYWVRGVDYFDGKTFVRYPPDPANPQRLPEGVFYGCTSDADGLIWLAGPSGLSRLDPSTAIFTTYQIDPEHPANEVNRALSSVFAGRHSPREIWVGTSSGLFQFDKASGRFMRHYMKQDGLCSDGVQAIQRDDQGRLWLGTVNGLSCFDPNRGTFRNYDLVDGLPGKKFYNGAAAKTSDGRMFFGTTKGLVTFNPARMADNTNPPPVALIDFELFNKPVGVSEKESPLRKAITTAEEITLTHNQSVFTFKFAALNFTAPEKNRYAYRMEGFDEDWRYTDASRRFATYTRLAPGNYTFRVKASNNDGLWNDQGTSIRIIVLPPLWQTWWFRGLASAVALSTAYLAYALRIRRIKLHNLKLEREVAARTADLLTKSAALETANRELESFSYSVSHDLRAPLRSIDGFSRALLEDYNGKLDAEGRENLQTIRNASQRMGVLIDDMLRLSQLNRSEMRWTDVNLSQIAEELAHDLKKSEPHRSGEFVIAPNMAVRGDTALLRIALANILSNAWKYTGKKPFAKIEFGSNPTAEGRVFFVRDNGCGFDMEYVHKLFGAFQRLHTTDDFPGTGVGLASVQRVIQRHGGKVWIEGKVDQGTTVYFTLPNSSQ